MMFLCLFGSKACWGVGFRRLHDFLWSTVSGVSSAACREIPARNKDVVLVSLFFIRYAELIQILYMGPF